jgi:hypothetical protein
MAVFIAMFRVFVLLQPDLLGTHSQTPPQVLVITLPAVFLFFAAVDSAAYYGRHSHLHHAETEAKVIFSTKAAVILFDGLFMVGSLVDFVIVAAANEGTNVREAVHFGTVVDARASRTFSHIVFVITGASMYALLPDMLVCSAHLTFAAITLFLLHSGRGPARQSLEIYAK